MMGMIRIMQLMLTESMMLFYCIQVLAVAHGKGMQMHMLLLEEGSRCLDVPPNKALFSSTVEPSNSYIYLIKNSERLT